MIDFNTWAAEQDLDIEQVEYKSNGDKATIFNDFTTYTACNAWAARQPEIDQLKAHIASQNDLIEAQKACREHIEQQFDEITSIATELAQYASYAEIIGCVTHNRAAVRKHCDAVFNFNRRADAEQQERQITST